MGKRGGGRSTLASSTRRFPITSPRPLAFGAKTPWNTVRCSRAGGTTANSRFTNSPALSVTTLPFLLSYRYRPSSSLASRLPAIGPRAAYLNSRSSPPRSPAGTHVSACSENPSSLANRFPRRPCASGKWNREPNGSFAPKCPRSPGRPATYPEKLRPP